MKKIMKGLLAGLVILASASINAVTLGPINGSMTISGEYVATGLTGNDLTTVTDITLSTVLGGTPTGTFATTIDFFTPDGSGGVLASVSLSDDVTSFFSYGGWQLNLDSLIVASDTKAGFLHLTGTGLVSGNGYDATNATWSFSANDATAYSMSVTAVPVPAAVWLFGSGLLGLIGMARRKV